MSTIIERENDEIDEEEREARTLLGEDKVEPNNNISDNNIQQTTFPYDFSNKTVKQLTQEERNKLISDHENGIDNQYFRIVKDKHGRVNIRAKHQMNTTAQKLNVPKIPQKSEIMPNINHSFTNEQMILEHIIELENKYENLRMKHRKLKKRYNKLEADIYADDEAVSEPTPKMDQRYVHEVEPVQQPIQQPIQQQNQHQIPLRPRVKSSWRSRIDYMN